MADIVDTAQDHIEKTMADAIRAARAPIKQQANGSCHNCNAPVPHGLLYCDALCREDHEREQQAKRRNGTLSN